jgi:hypothetical protein
MEFVFCKVCEKKFVRTRYFRVYCSLKCRKEGYYQAMVDWQKANPPRLRWQKQYAKKNKKYQKKLSDIK